MATQDSRRDLVSGNTQKLTKISEMLKYGGKAPFSRDREIGTYGMDGLGIRTGYYFLKPNGTIYWTYRGENKGAIRPDEVPYDGMSNAHLQYYGEGLDKVLADMAGT